MKILLVLIVCALQQVSGVIYSLNETEYDRLPPLFRLDEFYPCLRSPGDTYCYVDAKLTANASNELMHIIEEYSSANTVTHYDHTLIHWGICVTKTCRHYLTNATDLNEAIEACLNSSLHQDYQLQARLVEGQVLCTEYGETVPIDAGDIVVAVVVFVILALNVLGSLYDICWIPGNSLLERSLLCFSVKRSWKRLVAPFGDGPEPRLRRLKFFNGIKSCTTFFVVMGHSPLAAVIMTNNPHFVELTYYDVIHHIFYNGSLIVQSFFVMSGCLRTFNQLLVEEKVKISWNKFFKLIMLRWMRLSPPYAAVLAIIATWMRRLGNGPMYKTVVGAELEDCRKNWYYHLLYVNNYIDHSSCMAHSWYLATDFQLTIIGLLIFCTLKTWRARKIAIGVAFAVGVITPAAQIYFHNLHAILLLTPEAARQYFLEDPTFNNLYKRGHTNIVCYAIGMALGMCIYKLMQTNVDVSKYKKYRYVYWATVPVFLLLILSGGIFFMDGIQVPLAVRVLYAPVNKILFGMMVFILMLGTVFKLETVYRGILEWRGWTQVSRVSYCAYLVHLSIIRYSVANHTSLLHSNFFQAVYAGFLTMFSFTEKLLTYFGHLVLTFVVALPCWMLIEAPFNELVKLYFYPTPEEQEHKANTEMNGTTQVFVINMEQGVNSEQLNGSCIDSNGAYAIHERKSV